MIPACATPTACVFVIATGPSNVPDSLIQDTPVISPLPFWESKPAATGSPVFSGPRGWMAVTPVRTKLPSISVTYPTSTPRTSVMAFHRPGRPPNGIPSARARGLPPGVVRCGSGVVMVISVTIRGASSPDVPPGRRRSGMMAGVDRKQRVNAILERTIGYQFSRPLADRAWRVPPPKLLNSVLVRVTGYQLSRPLASRAWNLPAAGGGRLLTAPVFIFSAPRSGSTLLRVILGSHSSLYAPPELPLKHLAVRAETQWIQASLEGLGLGVADL